MKRCPRCSELVPVDLPTCFCGFSLLEGNSRPSDSNLVPWLPTFRAASFLAGVLTPLLGLLFGSVVALVCFRTFKLQETTFPVLSRVARGQYLRGLLFALFLLMAVGVLTSLAVASKLLETVRGLGL